MNIGFVSTRFSGTDGVSLEASKWADVLEKLGHRCFWFSGLNDRPAEVSRTVPEAFFSDPGNEEINAVIWNNELLNGDVCEKIRALSDHLKAALTDFVESFAINVLLPENAITIPMNVPLGLAITEFVEETCIPCLAHHHDFYWERDRFAVSSIDDLLDRAFPPKLSTIQHTVINSIARDEMMKRRGIDSTVIPNVFDFETSPPPPDDYVSDLRESIGLKEEDIFVLQPTRIVPRKGIEHAIDLISRLDDPRYKLVISHDAGDEGLQYRDRLIDLAAEKKVELLFISDRVRESRTRDTEGRKLYTLWDLYPQCDLVTYPSDCEGFGNALLEAVYFRKPVMLNRYPVYEIDIEPKGFRFAMMDREVGDETIREVKKLLDDKEYREEVVDHNFAVAEEHYSYRVLREQLSRLLTRENQRNT